MTCPRCGSEQTVEVIYGLPAPGLFERAERGEVVLGGCEPTDAERACRSCGLTW